MEQETDQRRLSGEGWYISIGIQLILDMNGLVWDSVLGLMCRMNLHWRPAQGELQMFEAKKQQPWRVFDSSLVNLSIIQIYQLFKCPL